jgi:hypothetical protein
VAPVFAAVNGDHMRRATAPGPASALASTESLSVDQLELVGRPIDEAVADWFASIGESFSQLTFFLFDPESWR